MSSYWNIKPQQRYIPSSFTPGGLENEETNYYKWAQHWDNYQNGYYSDLQQPLLLSYAPHHQWSQDAKYIQGHMQWLENLRRYPPSPLPPLSTPVQGDGKGHLRYTLGARPRTPASTQSEPSPVSSSVWARPPRLVDLSQDLVWASAPASPVYPLRQALNEDSEADSEEGSHFLTERANVHRFAVNGKKGLGATFPFVTRRRRAESFSDLIQPEDITARGWPEKSPYIGEFRIYVLARFREQQWRSQWGHEPGRSPQYYAQFFWGREPAYSRSEREMWEVRERYEQDEKILQEHRLKQIREQVQLGPWHGMTREEKKRGKNKAKRARQRERERGRREAERLANRVEGREEERGGEGGEEDGKGGKKKEDEGKEEDVEIKGEGKEEVEQEEEKEDAKQEEENPKKEEPEPEDEQQEERGEEEPNDAEQDLAATTPTFNLPPSPPPTPWPPHYCNCFSYLQCAAHKDIPDSCHLCASFYFAGYWCGAEKGWCYFVPFVEESKVLGRKLKVMRAGEGIEEWGVVGWDEEADEGRGQWV